MTLELGKIESALSHFESALIEPIDNPNHKEPNKRKVIEVNCGSEEPRWFGYGETYAEALVEAHTKRLDWLATSTNP